MGSATEEADGLVRVGISAEFVGIKPCGVETYTRTLLAGLAEIEGPHKFAAYVSSREAMDLVPWGPNVAPRLVRPYASWFRVPVTLPLELLRHPIDLLHVQNWAPPWSPCPAVATIHDLSWEVQPDLYPPMLRYRLSLLVRATARRAVRVVTDSHHSAADLVRFYDVPPEKIRVVYPALDPRFTPSPALATDEYRARHGLIQPYVLYLGSIEPRKNVDVLIRAYATLRRDRQIPHQLVIAGPALRLFQEVLDLPAALGIEQDVRFLGIVAPDDVSPLFGGADAFCYLAGYEGFGYPALEAMACGAPVLAANTASLPEVLGDAALLVDPHKPGDVARGLERLLTDGDLRNLLRARGLKRATHFEPRSFAQGLVSIYEECAQAAGRAAIGRRPAGAAGTAQRGSPG